MKQLVGNFFRWLKISLPIEVEHLIFFGIIYLIFYVWKNKKLWAAKIQQKYPGNKHVFREIRYSIYTLFMFGAVMTFVVWAGKHHLTRGYTPINKYGYGYYFLSIVLMLIVHDAYYYWGHRLLHSKWLYKKVHRTHHLSINPTPFAAYAFHPVEAVFQVSILIVIVFTIPHHSSAVTIFGAYSVIVNVAGHLGYEFLPKNFIRNKLFKWHNTSTHHNLHHQYFKCNYSIYFNFWDRVMKTNHPDNDLCFDEVAERRQLAKDAGSSKDHMETVTPEAEMDGTMMA